MIIGIPKALIYWKKPYFWEEFFKSLGFEVLLSPSTNKEIVSIGVKIADPETCLSTKIYWGHLLWLEGKCDFIFVPRMKTNKEKLEYCPKFFALPDLAKIRTKTPILTGTFDERREKFEKTLRKLGKKLGKNRKEVEIAFNNALLKEKEEEDKRKEEFVRKVSDEKPKIVLISHPYNLYDIYVNLRTKEKLENLGIRPIFIDEVPVGIPLEEDSGKAGFHWESGKEILEKVGEILKYDIVGGVQISSLQCGCDVVIKEFVEKKFKDKKIPFLYIIIDEHTGEAGLQTRLEAFTDTLISLWKNQ